MKDRPYSFGWADAGGGALIVLLLCGCRAGYYAPRPGGQLSYGANVVRSDLDPWDVPTADLQHELMLTKAGQLLFKALNAHGGWDRWRVLEQVEYRRSRVDERLRREADAEVVERPPGGTAAPAAVGGGDHEAISDERQVVFDPREWGGADDEETWLFSLPFLLLHDGYTQEYLGVEIDVGQGLEFQMIRFVRSGVRETLPAQFVTYFDSSSGLLKQVLLNRESGDWLLFQFRGWESVDGLRVATRRRIYGLETLFRRPRPDSLLWSDTLVDIKCR